VPVFKTLQELAERTGRELGISEWVEIDQQRIDRFAIATDDHQWIHIDPERVSRELGTPTIAHGYLTLSLVPRFMYEIVVIESVRRSVNYGANKLRFTNTVHAGSRVRGRVHLSSTEFASGSLRAVTDMTVEIEGEEKPALVAELITLFYE